MTEPSQTDATNATDATFTKPSLRVIKRVTDAEDVEPHALDPPLYDAVDPTALDRLFATGADDSPARGHVSFQYLGYDLVIDADGRVELR